MGTIETGSSIRFRKGWYHFCSSNGLVSAAVYTNVTGERTDKKMIFSSIRRYASEKVCTISVAQTVWCQWPIRKRDTRTDGQTNYTDNCFLRVRLTHKIWDSHKNERFSPKNVRISQKCEILQKSVNLTFLPNLFGPISHFCEIFCLITRTQSVPKCPGFKVLLRFLRFKESFKIFFIIYIFFIFFDF